MAKQQVQFQRNAFVPGIIAAIALFIAPAVIETDAFTIIRFIVAPLALIVAWFAGQARQWWWVVVFVVVAVLWNPVFPFAFVGWPWAVAQVATGATFIVAGALIKFEVRVG